MQASYIIGIDIGTGSTKAVAVGHDGQVRHTAQQYYTAINDGEKSEQDASTVCQAFQQCIREVVAAIGAPPVAVSLSSAMHSIMAVDEKGAPLTKAMLWSDTRSSKIAAALRTSSLGKRIYLATGTPLHSMSPLCKIKWLQENAPDIFSKAAKFISIKEFIWHQLFDEYVIDHSLASATGLFNVLHLQWEEEALSFAGINGQQLSAPVPVTYTKAGIKSSVAAAMQLPAETPVLVGASDGTLANLGSLCLSADEAAITIGTSGAVRITSSRPVQNFERMIFNYLLDEQTFVCGGAINNGGNVFEWLLKNIFAQHKQVTKYEQLFALLPTVPPGCDGLLFLPYLHGERAPIWDEESCGLFIGLTSAHTLSHLARAVAEGVCFALYHILSSIEEICGSIDKINISGGIVHSGEMMQLLADVTGKRVVVQQTEDASALGAVYLAQKAMGIIRDYAVLPEKETSLFQPNSEVSERYRQLFFLYKSLYPAVKDQMHLLHQLTP
jgi:gluconokinase